MKPKHTMTDVLKREIKASGLSIYAIAKGSGLARPSLLWFMAGKRSLRLDKADILAAYLGLELVKTKRKGR